MLDLEESLDVLDPTDIDELMGFAAESKAYLNAQIIGVFEDLVGVELEDYECDLVHAEIDVVRSEDPELLRSQVARLLGLFIAFHTEILGPVLLKTDLPELLEEARETILVTVGGPELAPKLLPEKTES